MIDVAIPPDRNLMQKAAQQKLKYKNLGTGVWNIKCFVIPVITVVTGNVTKGLKKYLETIPGNHLIDPLQGTTVLRTSHIIRKLED
jgi:hypothetical protein